jgi:hypothetical protein
MRADTMVAVAMLAAAAGCSSMSDTFKTTPGRTERPATDVPWQFVLADGALNNNSSCRTPIVDPRDKATLQLERADRGYGDYRVPEGKYGVAGIELLRVDCTTGRTVGVVRQ